jgi:hypothetical protein
MTEMAKESTALIEMQMAEVYGYVPAILCSSVKSLEDVHAVGFPAYEKAHRQALVALAAKCFPCLPKEVAAQVAAFAFHVGCYSPPRSTFWRDFHAQHPGPL